MSSSPEALSDGRTVQAPASDVANRLMDRSRFGSIIGKSGCLLELFDLIVDVAASDANILIVGESGTGKELIASAIHDSSNRATGPFIKINCAAIPHELIESEVFGYRKGAFTGATLSKRGLFELAEHGSLLLDEIGEMAPCLQTKLLRVLQDREYRPIGGERSVKADFRLITSTNLDIDRALQEGKVREDLYFRINTIVIKVPPLRARADDIPLLCEHFLEKYRQRYQRSVQTISPSSYSLLSRSRWPGNVRELENAIERAVLLCKGPEIMPGDLPESLRHNTNHRTDIDTASRRTLAEIEKVAILRALHSTNWNKRQAAAILGLHRPTLYKKMKQHGLGEMGTVN